MYQGYDYLLKTHRLTTTTASGAILAFSGDACTQTATSDGGLDDYDLKRGISFALFGAAITGPINLFWLSRLDTLVQWLVPRGG